MAAPFVTLFGSDEISAFEAVMSVFMWWGHSFHATYPHPPVHIIGMTYTHSPSNSFTHSFTPFSFFSTYFFLSSHPCQLSCLTISWVTFLYSLLSFNVLTDSIDDVIKIHDPTLHHHLEVVGIRSGFLGWSLIKTMFSEILGYGLSINN